MVVIVAISLLAMNPTLLLLLLLLKHLDQYRYANEEQDDGCDADTDADADADRDDSTCTCVGNEEEGPATNLLYIVLLTQHRPSAKCQVSAQQLNSTQLSYISADSLQAFDRLQS